MFAALKPSTLVVLVASLTTVVAFDIEPLVEATAGGPTVIKWTSAPTDPVFSIELLHPDFNSALAIANNVNPQAGKVEVTLPDVPPSGGYTLQFVNITNIDQSYGESSEFSIAPPVSTTESSTASGTATGTITSTSAGSATATMPMSIASTSPYMSGASHSPSASGSASASAASASAASASASSAATRNLLRGGRTAATCTGVVLLGLLSAAWIL